MRVLVEHGATKLVMVVRSAYEECRGTPTLSVIGQEPCFGVILVCQEKSSEQI